MFLPVEDRVLMLVYNNIKIFYLHFRLRNVMNKLTNVSEALGLAKQTPMALILTELGIELDLTKNN